MAPRGRRPGIGPFAEDDALSMAVAQMQTTNGSQYLGAGKRRYPSGSHVCDLAIGSFPDWAIEVKRARLGRDNGTYEDAAIKKILSPYSDDRSAVKLLRSSFAGRRASTASRTRSDPLRWLIGALEAGTEGPSRLDHEERRHFVAYRVTLDSAAAFGQLTPILVGLPLFAT